jgi:AraC-like DNA-binding protein
LTAAQAVFHLAHDPSPRTAPLVRFLAHRHAELGGDDQIVPAALDGPADDLLGLTAGVDVGGVDDVDAGLERAVDDPDRVLVIRVAHLAEHHRAESPSQFSREYRRTFGVPPGRDAVRLTATV